MSAEPAHCEWCGTELPDDSSGRRFCKPTHRTNAKRKRNGQSRHSLTERTARQWQRMDEAQRRMAEATCEVKWPFGARWAAEEAIRKRMGGVGSVYPCGDHFHITRRPVNAPRDWRKAYEAAS